MAHVFEVLTIKQFVASENYVVIRAKELKSHNLLKGRVIKMRSDYWKAIV